jgi:hypothetical protein
VLVSPLSEEEPDLFLRNENLFFSPSLFLLALEISTPPLSPPLPKRKTKRLYSSKFNIIHTSQIPNLYYAFQFFAEKIVSFHRLFQKQQQHQQYQQGYFNFNNIVPIRNTRNVVSPRSLDVVFKMIDFQKD